MSDARNSTSADRDLLARLRDEHNNAVEAADRVLARDAEAASVHAATEAERAEQARLKQENAASRAENEQLREAGQALRQENVTLGSENAGLAKVKRDLEAEIAAMRAKLFGESVPA